MPLLLPPLHGSAVRTKHMCRRVLFEDLPQLSGSQTRPSHYIRTRPPWAVSCPASECRASSARTCQGVQPASMRHAPRDVVTVYNWRKHWRITHMGTEQKNQGKDTKNRLLSCARFRHKSTHDSRSSSLFFTHLLSRTSISSFSLHARAAACASRRR